jgi:hypothetical protein
VPVIGPRRAATFLDDKFSPADLLLCKLLCFNDIEHLLIPWHAYRLPHRRFVIKIRPSSRSMLRPRDLNLRHTVWRRDNSKSCVESSTYRHQLADFEIVFVVFVTSIAATCL